MTRGKLWRHSAQHTKSSTTALFLDKPTSQTSQQRPPLSETAREHPRAWQQASGSNRARHLHPQSSPVPSGAQRADSSRGRATPRASTAQAPSEKYRLAGAVHAPWRAEVFISIPELRMCKACAAFPVMLVRRGAPRWPSAWLGAHESASTPSLSSRPPPLPFGTDVEGQGAHSRPPH